MGGLLGCFDKGPDAMMMFVRRDDILGATSPPPGVTPNFVNPVSRAHVVIVMNVACTVVSVSFVGLRCYTAFCITRRPRKMIVRLRPLCYEKKKISSFC